MCAILSCSKLISLPTADSLQINFPFSFLFRSLRAAFCGTLFSSPLDLLLKAPIVIFRNHKKKEKTPRPDSIGLLLHHTINTPLKRRTNGITSCYDKKKITALQYPA